MFLIHPVLQSAGILIALSAFVIGIARFRALHLKQKVRFNWKMHVRSGIAATTIWIVGIFVGLFMVKNSWHAFLVTGYHGKTGLLMIPFILFAMGSGIYMNLKKKKRKILPIVHAILNTAMLLLALSQVYTGILVYKTFVLGIY